MTVIYYYYNSNKTIFDNFKKMIIQINIKENINLKNII